MVSERRVKYFVLPAVASGVVQIEAFSGNVKGVPITSISFHSVKFITTPGTFATIRINRTVMVNAVTITGNGNMERDVVDAGAGGTGDLEMNVVGGGATECLTAEIAYDVNG